jgi:hypothetical protein
MEPAAGKRPQDEQEAGGGGEEGGGAGQAEEPESKRARPEGPDAEDEEGMVTEESQGQEAMVDEDEDEEEDIKMWLEKKCQACLDEVATRDAKDEDEDEEPSRPIPEGIRCFCDVSHEPEDFSWVAILNRVPPVTIQEAVEAMDGQHYWNGNKAEVFRFQAVVNKQTVKQVLESYLNLKEWRWRTPHKISDQEKQELAELTEKSGAQGMQGIAAIRAWTEEDLGLYKIVTSVSHRATSKQCLQKILPYLRLLYDGLSSLPASYVCAGEKLHRGEKFIREEFKHNLKPGDALKFKLHGCPGFSCTFNSFTTDPQEAAKFKNSSAMFYDVYDGVDLISTDSEPTLSLRLKTFFEKNYPCEECQELLGMYLGGPEGIAAEFENHVGQLNTMLKKRFGKDLPQKKQQPERTIIVVQDGVGYRLGNLSVVPNEKEVLMEPGARLQVVVDNRTDAAQYGEGLAQFLLLKTETCRGESVLTEKDGRDFRSLAKKKECEVVEERLEVDAFKAFQREKRTGGCIQNLSPEILRQLQKIVRFIPQSPITSKGCLGKRSATRGGLSEDQKAQTLINQLWEEAHDFDGACNWLLQVTVKQHDGEDDEVGKRISKVQTGKDYRCYSVDPGQLLKVTVKNLSLVRTISFTPVYVDEAGNDDPGDPRTLIELQSGKSQELTIALKKDREETEETEDGWDLRDAEGTKTLLRLRFAVAPPT